MRRCLEPLAPLPSSCFRVIAPPCSLRLTNSTSPHSRSTFKALGRNASHLNRGHASQAHDTVTLRREVSEGHHASHRLVSSSPQLPPRASNEAVTPAQTSPPTLDHVRLSECSTAPVQETSSQDESPDDWSESASRKDWSFRKLSSHSEERLAKITKALLRREQVDGLLGGIDKRAAGWADAFLQSEPVRKMWLNALTWLLVRDPDRVLEFLLATHHAPYPPQNWISRSLRYIAERLDQQGGPSATAMAVRLVGAIDVLSKRTEGDPLVLRWPIADRLYRHLSEAQQMTLYDTILESHVQVSHVSLLSFAALFAQHSEVKRAAEAYLWACRVGAGRSIDQSRRVCCYILRAATNTPDGLRQCLELCTQLRAIGKPPTVTMANALILSALDAGDVKIAMEMYHIFFDTELRPDERTIGLLIKAFKLDNNIAMPLMDIVNLARQAGVLGTNDVLCTDLLHTTVQSGMLIGTGNAWTDAWNLYSEMYDTTALQQLGLPPPDRDSRPQKDTVRQPPTHAVGIMLHSYLKLLRTNDQPNTTAAYELWKQFQTIITAGDDSLARLATSDHCFNMFLYTFVLNPRTLLYATEVMKEMQTPFPEPSILQKAEPTNISWNIFLLGFKMNKQEALAEQVLTHMEEKGIKPSQIAWEQLVDGYAESQNMDGLLNALRRAEQSGAIWTEWMDRAVGRFKNQHKLKKALIAHRMEESLDFSDDLVAQFSSKLGDDLQTSTEPESGRDSRDDELPTISQQSSHTGVSRTPRQALEQSIQHGSRQYGRSHKASQKQSHKQQARRHPLTEPKISPQGPSRKYRRRILLSSRANVYAMNLPRTAAG